eukprot:gene17218-biopygen12861
MPAPRPRQCPVPPGGRSDTARARSAPGPRPLPLSRALGILFKPLPGRHVATPPHLPHCVRQWEADRHLPTAPPAPAPAVAPCRQPPATFCGGPLLQQGAANCEQEEEEEDVQGVWKLCF